MNLSQRIYCILATLQNVCIIGYYSFYILKKNLKISTDFRWFRAEFRQKPMKFWRFLTKIPTDFFKYLKFSNSDGQCDFVGDWQNFSVEIPSEKLSIDCAILLERLPDELYSAGLFQLEIPSANSCSDRKIYFFSWQFRWNNDVFQ